MNEEINTSSARKSGIELSIDVDDVLSIVVRLFVVVGIVLLKTRRVSKLFRSVERDTKACIICATNMAQFMESASHEPQTPKGVRQIKFSTRWPCISKALRKRICARQMDPQVMIVERPDRASSQLKTVATFEDCTT